MLTIGLSWDTLPPLQTTVSTHPHETFPVILFYVLNARCVCWALRNSEEEYDLRTCCLYRISWVPYILFNFSLLLILPPHSLLLDDIGVLFKVEMLVHARTLPFRGWPVRQKHWHHLGLVRNAENAPYPSPTELKSSFYQYPHIQVEKLCLWAVLFTLGCTMESLSVGLSGVGGVVRGVPSETFLAVGGDCQQEKAGHHRLGDSPIIVLAVLTIAVVLKWSQNTVSGAGPSSASMRSPVPPTPQGRIACCHAETVVWRAQRRSARWTLAVGTVQWRLDMPADLPYWQPDATGQGMGLSSRILRSIQVGWPTAPAFLGLRGLARTQIFQC